LHACALFLEARLCCSPSSTEIRLVKHIQLQSDDVPHLPFVMDRRRAPDRRTTWRGGRRDSDWNDRPLGAWDRFDPSTRPRWRQVLASLHVW
jgi:hypothetical protein